MLLKGTSKDSVPIQSALVQKLEDQMFSSNFTPQVKEARNQSQIFNRKSISRNATHCQSYHLQAMLTGVKRRKANTRSEKVNNLKTAMKKRADPTATNKTKPKCLAELHAKAEASNFCINDKNLLKLNAS